MDVNPKLLERFARRPTGRDQPTGDPDEGEGKGSIPRRSDYKGARVRLNLRIPEPLGDDLDILVTILAEADKNSFCVEAIEKAVGELLRKERERLGEQAWEVVVRCALGGKGRGEGR